MVFDIWVKSAIVIVGLLVIVAGKVFWNLSSSNPIEQIAEEVVEKETGIKIDVGSSDETTPK